MRSTYQQHAQIIARKFNRRSEKIFCVSLTVNCRFCGQDEEHDPGEEFEEWLSCAVCGDNGMFIISHNPKNLKGKKEQMQHKYSKYKIRGSKR